MLISQKHYASGQSIVSWLSGIGGVVAATSTDLVLQNSDGTFTHLIGSAISYDSGSNTWTGSFTKAWRAMTATPDSPGTIGITTEIAYGTGVSVSALTAGLTGAFLWQLMNVPGNTNAGFGTSGNDTFAGSNQADSFDGGAGTDVVDYRFATQAVSIDLSGAFAAGGAAAGDVLTAIEGVRGGALADVLRGTTGANLLDGAGGDDTLYASAGADTLIGGDGWDRLDLTGLGGDLVAYGGAVGATQFSGFESFVTGAGNDMIYGQPGKADYITNAGNDAVTLSGNGQKTLLSGAGDDTVSVFGADGVALAMGDGSDVLSFVISSGAFETITMTEVGGGTLSGVISGTVSGLEVVSSEAMRLAYSGHDGQDVVHASSGSDTLLGNGGDDRLYGGNGNDLIYGDGDWGVQGGSAAYGSDLVQAGGGNDTIIASNGADSHSGGIGIDVLTYAQLFDDYGNGEYSIALNADNTVTKIFRDWYGDAYTETDTIVSGAGDEIEVIVGTALGDTLSGNAQARILDGGAGADLYLITAANGGDTIRGMSNGADVLRVGVGASATAILAGDWVADGSSFNNGVLTIDTMGFDVSLQALGGSAGATLRNDSTTDGSTMTGTAFADRFESHSALDVMTGGAGDDTYVVLGSGPIPLIFEDAGGGTDTLITATDGVYLGSTLENVTLVGTAVTVRGNPYANRITGNDMANVLYGGGGADTLQGGLGSDTYYYTGSETLIEGAYRPRYYDMDLGWVTDPDRDRVMSSVSFALTDSGFEDLTLQGSAKAGTGNLQANAITGTIAANLLKGLEGNDTLTGWAGNDTLLGGVGADRLRGDAGADTLRGEGGNDSLIGGDGADRLEGGAGRNLLTGGRGADLFVFGKLAETTTVSDFTDGVDKLAFAASTGISQAYILSHATQNGANVILHTTVTDMTITVLNTTIAALAGDILIL